MNNFDTYQKGCRLTAIYPDTGNNPIYPLLEISGETGELAHKLLSRIDKCDQSNFLCHVLRLLFRTGQVAELLKKVIRDDDKEISTERGNRIADACLFASQHLNAIAKSLSDGMKQIDPIWIRMNMENSDGILAELGDLLYGIASEATECRLNLSDCAQNNVDKLTDRWERGTISGEGDNR